MNEHYTTTNLMQFQAHVVHGHQEGIQAFITALATERGNHNLAQLAAQHQYITWYQSDTFQGHRVMLARDLAYLGYGRENIGTLAKLFERKGIDFLRETKGNYHNGNNLIKAHFGLSKYAPDVKLVAWPHVLIVGANGETEFARKLWAYIQTMVTLAEADQESRAQTGMGLQENIQQQLTAVNDYPELKAIMELVEGVAQTRKVAEAAQQEAEHARQEAQQAMLQATLATSQQAWLTIREYIYLHKLIHQCPEAQWASFGRYLTGYCMEHGIPIRKQPIYGKPYESEQSYHVEVIAQQLAPWLKRQAAQPYLRAVPTAHEDA